MIGKLIRLYRVANNISIREMAVKLGMSTATLSRIENGKPCDQQHMVGLICWLFSESP